MKKMNIIEKIDIFLIELSSLSSDIAASSMSLYNKRFGSKEDFAGWLEYKGDKSSKKKKKSKILKKLRKKLGL